MKCCVFNYGKIIEINYNVQPGVHFITIAKDPQNIYTAIVLVTSDSTLVMDKNYNEISLEDLEVGNLIFVYHSPVMTMSIPPQTQAFIIEVK